MFNNHKPLPEVAVDGKRKLIVANSKLMVSVMLSTLTPKLG